MNDDIERRLRQVTPQGAPPELRSRVLAAVAGELNAATRSRRTYRPLLAVAAAVLAALALNYWVNYTVDQRLAIVLGPPPVRIGAAEIAADVGAVADPSIGQWVYERLAASQPPGDDALRYAVRLRQMIQQLTVDLKETSDEASQENSQMDRDRRRSGNRHPADAQRVLRLEHRNTA